MNEEDISDEEEYTYEYEDASDYEEDVSGMEEANRKADFEVSFTMAVPTSPTQSQPIQAIMDTDILLRVPQRVLNEEGQLLEDMVWVHDPKCAYRLVNVIERHVNHVIVDFCDENGNHEKKVFNICDTQSKSLSHYCEDMCHLTELNEPSVLHTIRSRYNQKLIHTYSGLFCVVVNPWCKIPLYTPQVIDYYMNESELHRNLPPHIYSIAQSAYNGILQGTLFRSSDKNVNGLCSQSILITGESGAGKTENTKRMIEYLLRSATRNVQNHNKYVKEEKMNRGLDSAILNAGIVFEAFSNAKTVHNNNSSRVGKFIRLDFDERARLSTARIDCYLLEKSRVVNHNVGDRNFHFFYQIFSDVFIDDKQRRTLGLLKSPEEYRFLNQGGCVHVNGINEREDAILTNRALDALDFEKSEKKWILECIAACILTGEIRFNERQGLDMSYVESPKDVDDVANLIGVNASRLIDALTRPTIRVGDTVIRKNQNLKKTLLLVSAFVKVIYERLFSWIVEKCNATIEAKSQKSNWLSNDFAGECFIGVLDMAGFEIMNQNGFEQFCINYTNEKLQQFFNQVLFVKERNDYVCEGIDWNEENYCDDLQQTIDLIERPLGLLSLLQEECIVPNGKDTSLLEKLYQHFDGNSNGIFTKSKYSSRNKSVNHFTIRHYAGNVHYNIEGWVEKNRDLVDQGLLDILSKSTHPLISLLFKNALKTEAMTKSRRGSFATSTISCVYKEQLGNLLQTLNSSQAHFVRCIVPNYERQPFALDGPLVMNQLKCNGVFEGIRVYRQGYPNRITFAEFLRRYNILYPTRVVGVSSFTFAESVLVENMCKNLRIDPARYCIGKTKIFCRSGLVSELEDRRKTRLNEIILCLQAHSRWYLAQSSLQAKQQEIYAMELVQNAVRRHATLRSWPWYRLWMKVRELIPLVRNQRRLAELEAENSELSKENKCLKVKAEEFVEYRRSTENQLEMLVDERENAQQKALELRQELKRSEELLELMERKFDDQHTKIMRLNSQLNDNVKILERMEEDKRVMDVQYKSLVKRHADESAAHELAQNVLKSTQEECTRLQTRIDAMFIELREQDEKIQQREEEFIEWKEKYDRKSEDVVELNHSLADANERVNRSDALLREEKNQRRRYESEIDDLEEEINRLRNEIEGANVKQEAMKEQLRLKENSIRKLELKLDDKCMEMESCLNELKKIHKSSQTEMQNQLEEVKRKCMKLEVENKQQKLIIDSNATNNNTMTTSSIFDRESSIDSDYGRYSTLGRHYSSRHHLFGGSSTSIQAACGGHSFSSSSSIRALSVRRRDTEPELAYGNSYYDMTASTYGSLGRSLSSSSSRLSRNGTLSNLTNTNTIDSGLARSSSSASNAATNAQLQSSERKVVQLERDLHNIRTDGHLMKREVEVYKESLQNAEMEKERLEKQVHSLVADLEQLTKALKAGEDRNQQLTFDARKAFNECEAWKKRVENTIQDSRNELLDARKKYKERLDEQRHEYELKFAHLSNTEKNYDKLQSDLVETQNHLDKALGQVAKMERLHKSQDVIGVTWESQYRTAIQEMESLRDENAALKSKIRRQYKQIELLTQQSEMNEYMSDLESKVGQFNDRIEKSTSIIEIPVQITGHSINSPS